jgi:hypothetical protein
VQPETVEHGRQQWQQENTDLLDIFVLLFITFLLCLRRKGLTSSRTSDYGVIVFDISFPSKVQLHKVVFGQSSRHLSVRESTLIRSFF